MVSVYRCCSHLFYTIICRQMKCRCGRFYISMWYVVSCLMVCGLCAVQVPDTRHKTIYYSSSYYMIVLLFQYAALRCKCITEWHTSKSFYAILFWFPWLKCSYIHLVLQNQLSIISRKSWSQEVASSFSRSSKNSGQGNCTQ